MASNTVTGNRSKIVNCYIEIRKGDTIIHMTDQETIVTLDGYAILPVETYREMKKRLVEEKDLPEIVSK